MPSSIPAPTPGFLIAGDGGASVATTKPGVTLRGGLGMTVTNPAAGVVQLAGQNVDPMMGANLFLPGALAAKASAARLWIPNAKGSTFVRLIEANLKTGATAADVTNFMRLTVRGAASGSVNLDLTSTAGYFRTTRYSTVGQQATGGGGLTCRGFASRFRTTAAISVGAVAFSGTYAGGAQNDTGKIKVIEIMDTAFNVLATSGPITSQLFDPANGLTQIIPLLNAAALAQNTDFIVAYRFTEVLPNTFGIVPGVNFLGGGAAAYSGNIVAPGTSPRAWTQSIDGVSAGAPWATLHSPDSGGSQLSAEFSLLGNTASVALSGESVFVDVVTVGTGGTPGADVNLHVGYTLS